MAIQSFNSKDDFLFWAKEQIKEDKEFLYNENMPEEFLCKIKMKEYDFKGHNFTESTYSDYMEYYFSYGKPKKELKKVLHNLKRLESMRSNQSIDLELFEKNINRFFNTEMIVYFNGLTNNINIKDIEPYQYYFFLNTVEEISFFIGSNIMKYKDLFSIHKGKFDRAIQSLKDSADKIAFCFDDDLIDHQIRIRLPLNPKVAISNMFFYLEYRWSSTNREQIISIFYECLIEYFIDKKRDKNTLKKQISRNLHFDFFAEIHSSYGVKVERLEGNHSHYFYERSLGNYSHYFYEPSIKQNYNYKS